MLKMIIGPLLLSVAFFIIARVMTTIHIKNYMTAIVIAFVYSIINFFIGNLLAFIALPLMFLTIGLFKFVINTFLLWLTDKLIEDFEIETIGSTVIAAVCITISGSIISMILDWVL